MVQATATNSNKKDSVWRRRIQFSAPYIITIAVLYFVLRRVSLSEIQQELHKGDGTWLFPIAFAVMVISLFLVSAADVIVCRAFLKDGRYLRFVRAKAASSLMDIVSYVIGHGGYAFWIGRVTGNKAGRTGGAMLYIMASDLLAITSIVTVASFFVDSEIGGSTIRTTVPLICLYLIFSMVSGPWTFLPPKKKPAVMMPWVEIPRRVGFLQVFVRICQLNVIVFGAWLSAKAFGLPLPLSAAIIYLPVIFLITSLPINVAGFGVAQTAWLMLNDYAPEAQILAFAFLYQISCIAAIVVRGLPFVKRFVEETSNRKEPEV